jgi:tRNA A-37 threonylcarbamoyl transferase component Bud32
MNARAPQSLIVTQVSPDDTSGSGTGSGRTTGAASQVLGSAIGRVRIAALISGVLWLLILAANAAFEDEFATWKFAGTAGWLHPNWIYALLGALGSFGLAFEAGRLRDKPSLVLDLGLGLEVFTAAMIALVTSSEFSPHAARVSWVTILILIYPSIAPTRPRRALIAGLLAASMDVLGIGLLMLKGYPLPGSGWELVGMVAWMVAPNYLSAFLALVPATLIRRLGREAGAARELGSYRLGRLLERGGMGEVYEATHRLIAKPAAIKLIRPELLADSPAVANVIIERFYREAEAVAALRSPHTVALYDFGVADDGTLYYVMELLDGIDLQRLVRQLGPLPASRVLHVMRQVCDSLGEAHARGLIHRDIKPSNIVLCPLGPAADFAKVLDFGLVRRESQAEAGLSEVAGQPGTPSYMAPEAVRNLPVDRRADLYALGCVAYWLLTGRTVFDGENPVQMMYQHGYEEPVPPSERPGASVPADLEQVILDLLAKDPDHRPQTAEDLAHRVAACVDATAWDVSRARAWWSEHGAAVRGSRSRPGVMA